LKTPLEALIGAQPVEAQSEDARAVGEGYGLRDQRIIR